MTTPTLQDQIDFCMQKRIICLGMDKEIRAKMYEAISANLIALRNILVAEENEKKRLEGFNHSNQ